MFEEAPNEKIERLRRTFQLAEASLDHIDREKLRLLNNLITFTKYLCRDLRSLPPVLSRFLIYSGSRITKSNIVLFPKAVFHHIERFQDIIIAEEDGRKILLEDEKEITDGKDGVIFEDAKKREDEVSTLLSTDEGLYLKKILKLWYENLHKTIKIAINSVYRNYAERKAYLQYLRPLDENLRRALIILDKIISTIELEKGKFEVVVKKLEEMERVSHEKFAFAR